MLNVSFYNYQHFKYNPFKIRKIQIQNRGSGRDPYHMQTSVGNSILIIEASLIYHQYLPAVFPGRLTKPQHNDPL